MRCDKCGRELREYSKFCDWCGNFVQSNDINNEQKSGLKANSFNTQVLIGGILLSILITLLITGTAKIFGFPLLFGGLFLPFLWRIKSKKE